MIRIVLAVVLLVTLASGQSTVTAAIPTPVQPIPKGLTLQATVWPSY